MTKFKKNWKDIIITYTGINIGAMLLALSLELFLVPHKIAPGGVSGLSNIIYHTFGITVGISMLIFNIPLFILGIKFLGKAFGARTLFGMIFVSIYTDLFHFLIKNPNLTDNTLLAAIYGAVLMGLGLGIAFKFGGSTGGTDIVVQIAAKYSNISTGSIIIILDTFIISLAGIVFRSMDLVLYALLALYISSKLVDIVLDGLEYAKSAHIISSKYDEVGEAIITKLSRGATSLYGKGLYTGNDRQVIYTVVTRKEIADLVHIVKSVDPDAFIIINNVHEVLGHGFRRRI